MQEIFIFRILAYGSVNVDAKGVGKSALINSQFLAYILCRMAQKKKKNYGMMNVHNSHLKDV